MMFESLCLLTGMVLAQRFKVLVVVPATALVVPLSIVVGIARSDAFWPIALVAVEAIVNLQVGYLLGAGIGALFGGVRANRTPATRVRGSPPTRRAVH
jgi:hypothetical protein